MMKLKDTTIKIKLYVIILITIFNRVHSLFEKCDEIYRLDGDTNSISLTSDITLHAKNTTSCRYTFLTEANYILKISCKLKFDQENSEKCPSKRFFLSVDGVRNLHRAQNFCNRNGTTRIIRRRSIMNSLVIAYVSKIDTNVSDDDYMCEVTKVNTQCECGWSKQARIFNGSDAKMHEFPSMVALLSISLNKVFCGGVIISERWFLTGAHCFNEEIYSDVDNVVAFVGEHDLQTTNETIFTESYEIQRFILHEKYSKDYYFQDYDIALVKTKLTIAFNFAVGPACLPFSFPHDAFDNKYVNAIGFGYLTYFDPKQATVLQKVSLKVLPKDECQDSKVNENKMCTYELNHDSCISDSGGPLILTVRGRQFAVGLISYGIGCGTIYPSINTRITSYLQWITSTLGAETILCRK